MKNFLQKRKQAEEAFRKAIEKDVIKTQKYVENLSKTDVNKILRDIKWELKITEFKNYLKGLLIQYDYDFEIIQDIIEQAFNNVRGKKKEEIKDEM